MSSTEAYNEPQVLQLLAEGSEYAFTQVFNQYRAKVYGVAMNLLKSQDLSEEIVQEVFLKVWMNRTTLSEIHTLDAWIFTVTRNIIFDIFKKQANERNLHKHIKEQGNERTYAGEDAELNSYRRLLEEAVTFLPPQQQRVYQMAKMEGLSHEQIANELQIDRSTVKSHMARALKAIRMHLEKNMSISLYISILISL
jgi:RNA polymerase sigma-70 factor (family 1)